MDVSGVSGFTPSFVGPDSQGQLAVSDVANVKLAKKVQVAEKATLEKLVESLPDPKDTPNPGSSVGHLIDVKV